jgi:hypothetical protein
LTSSSSDSFVRIIGLYSFLDQFAGLRSVGGAFEASRECAPSDEMWVTSITDIKRFFDEVIALLNDLKRMIPLTRYSEIGALVERPEWQLEAIFTRVRGKKMKSLIK